MSTAIQKVATFKTPARKATGGDDTRLRYSSPNKNKTAVNQKPRSAPIDFANLNNTSSTKSSSSIDTSSSSSYNNVVVADIQKKRATTPRHARHSKGHVTTRVQRSINGGSIIKMIQSNIIGNRYLIQTPFGEKEIVYADYTASGRALKFIEDYMVSVVSPAYANTHTEASATGAQTTYLREEARDIIRQAINAPKDEYAVLFTGSGSTAAIDKMFRVIGLGIPEYAEKKWNLSNYVPDHERPVVFISHFEHHSNELIWRESIARCVVIREGPDGSPDLAHLDSELLKYKNKNVQMIGSFSAGSNVTGIKAPVRSICKILHRHGAYAFIDYAGVGAYVHIDIKGPLGSQGNDNDDDGSIDAAFFSPHKFVGGPGSSGLLVARKKLFYRAFDIDTNVATCPGGGTVAFVSRKDHIYSDDIEHREDSGTPGILQSIRAGLVFKVKEMVGCDAIESLESVHCTLALQAWRTNRFISLMAADRVSYQIPTRRVSIFSFNVLSPICTSTWGHEEVDGDMSFSKIVAKATNHFARVGTVDSDDEFIPLHYNFVIALLNDVYGIQGRGGCSCAGPYGTEMFNFSSLSDERKARILDAYGSLKPGWARVNLNYFISMHEANFIVDAVKQIANHGWMLLPYYVQDWKSGQYFHHSLLDPVTGKKKTDPSRSMSSINDLKLVDDPLLTPTTKGVRETDVKVTFPKPKCRDGMRSRSSYRQVLSGAKKLYQKASKGMLSTPKGAVQDFLTELDPEIHEEDIWWLRPSQAKERLRSLQ